MKRLALAIVFVLGFAPPAWADFEAGVAAYNRGDYATALREFRPLAESGHTEAQFYLGQMYIVGDGVSQDLAKAENWYLKSAEGGNEGAQMALVFRYLDGAGFDTMPGAAAEWLQKLAERYSKIGWAHPAQVILGILYERGQGVTQDHREALKWYQIAARAKDRPGYHGLSRDIFGSPNVVSAAQNGVGGIYYQGKGFPRDYREAAKWFRLSAEQGDSKAQALLGHMYLQGEGLSQDYALAAKWSLMGAKQGNAIAQRNLGRMYVLGHGVPEDYVLAHMWYNLAAAAGDSYSAKGRDGLAKIMTSSQIEEAQRLAREWKPQKP